MTREDTANYINSLQPSFLSAAKHKGQFICPNCGHGKGGDGLKLYNGHWKCFGPCGENHNILGWYAIYKGLQDTPENYKEALEGAAAWYGVNIDGSDTIPAKNTTTKKTQTTAQEEKTDANKNREYFTKCAARIHDTEYLQLRGISVKTCEALGIGYDPEYKTFNKGENGTSPATWQAVIIPTRKGSYIARNTDTNADDQNRIRKGGPAYMFYTVEKFDNAPVYIVEGEIDAISLYEAGAQAIGIGGTSGIEKLVKDTIAPANFKENQIIIPLLDNDDPGQDAQAKLEELLTEIGVRFYTALNFYGHYKDANEYLKEDPEGLKQALQRTSSEALANIERENKEAAEAYKKENNVANQLQAFLNGIADSVNTPPISTGFEDLDKALEGGLYEGLYCLGAVSSLGKTTLTMQIADQIAQQGEDVLIISLEMARTQLMAKSISRHTLIEAQKENNIGLAKTSRGITTGARYEHYSDKEKQLIRKAIDKYSEYADHLYIKGEIGKIGTDEIREAVEEHKRIMGRAPILIIDYLQILKAYDVRATDKRNIDENVVALKQLSRDYKIPVFVISSFNREGYKGGAKEATMTDFKESGAIEYGADVLIGLHFKGAGQPGFDLDEAYNTEPREVELKILKNREGKPGQRIEYAYYPKFNYFTEWISGATFPED